MRASTDLIRKLSVLTEGSRLGTQDLVCTGPEVTMVHTGQSEDIVPSHVIAVSRLDLILLHILRRYVLKRYESIRLSLQSERT